jgi:hypothetical protein
VITFFAATSAPDDNSPRSGPTISITPPADMQEGDLVVCYVWRREANWPLMPEFAQGGKAGQRWSNAPIRHLGDGGGSTPLSGKIFWCRFRGAWAGNPSWRTSSAYQDSTSTLPMSVQMLVFRPTTASKHWVPNFYSRYGTFTAGSAPYTKTVASIATTPQHGSDSHVTIAGWFSVDDNTWGALAGAGWSKSGLADQYRNTAGSQMSSTFAYCIQSASGATGNVSQNQITNGGDAGLTSIISFTEIDLPHGGVGGSAEYVQSTITADNDGGSSETIALDAPIGYGNSIVGSFQAEDFASSNANARPIFPIVDDQGHEMVVVQMLHYAELNQIGLTFYCPAITNGAQSVTINYAEPVIATSGSVHEIDGGVVLHDFDGNWGFPGFDSVWDPLSAGEVTTTEACYIYCSTWMPGSHIDPPIFDYSGWGGTKREEIGSSDPPLNTSGSGDLRQSVAGTVNVTDSSGSSAATVIHVVALAPASGGGGGEDVELEGVAIASASAAASLAHGVPLQGAALTSSIAASALSLTVNLAGDSFVAALAAAQMTHGVPLQGAAAAGASGSSDLSVTSDASLAGNAIASANAVAVLALSVRLSGDAIVSVISQGDLGQQIALGGDADASADASGALSLTTQLSGALTASAEASAALSKIVTLDGDATARAQGLASLLGDASLSGAATAAAEVTGQLTLVVALTAQAVAHALATGELSVSVNLTGNAIAHALAGGELTVLADVQLQGDAIARAIGAGALAVSGGAQITHIRFSRLRGRTVRIRLH